MPNPAKPATGPLQKVPTGLALGDQIFALPILQIVASPTLVNKLPALAQIHRRHGKDGKILLGLDCGRKSAE